MSNRSTHIMAGASFGLAVYGIIKYAKKEHWTWSGALGSAALGGLGGALPDILEPATNPQHRQFLHSLFFGMVLLFGKEVVFDALSLNDEERIRCNSFLMGYASHLALDFATPAGLPLI